MPLRVITAWWDPPKERTRCSIRPWLLKLEGLVNNYRIIFVTIDRDNDYSHGPMYVSIMEGQSGVITVQEGPRGCRELDYANGRLHEKLEAAQWFDRSGCPSIVKVASWIKEWQHDRRNTIQEHCITMLQQKIEEVDEERRRSLLQEQQQADRAIKGRKKGILARELGL